MALTSSGESALRDLEFFGIEVLEDWSEDGNVQFGIANKSTNGCTCYFDMSGNWIRESFTNGEFINRMAVRQDIVEILDRHKLDFDFYDRGTMEVYDNGNGDQSVPTGASTTKSRKSMSKNAFLAFRRLARLGAPVWDQESHPSFANCVELPPNTQFVMKCEPEFDIVFADHATDEIKHFPQSGGLDPRVLDITSTYKLKHISYLHRYERERMMPERMIAFIDPNELETKSD